MAIPEASLVPTLPTNCMAEVKSMPGKHLTAILPASGATPCRPGSSHELAAG
jgi:hypothetical protein